MNSEQRVGGGQRGEVKDDSSGRGNTGTRERRKEREKERKKRILVFSLGFTGNVFVMYVATLPVQARDVNGSNR